MKKKKEAKQHYIYFDNPDTFVKQMYDLTPDGVKRDVHKEMLTSWRSKSDDDDFYGDMKVTYQTYVNAAFAPMSKLIDASLKMVDMDKASFLESRWEYALRQEEGDEVDIGRYLDGQDRYWNCCRKRKRGKDVVRVYFSGGANCWMSEAELAINGAVAVKVAETMEAHGFATELWLGFACERACTNNDGLTTLVKIKECDEYCDFGKIGFLCGQSKFFRTFGFTSFVATAERDMLTLMGGLGYSIPLTKENLCLEEEEGATSIVVPQLYNANSAREWLENFSTTNK